jgi:hypothetical protein
MRMSACRQPAGLLRQITQAYAIAVQIEAASPRSGYRRFIDIWSDDRRHVLRADLKQDALRPPL